MRALQVRFYFNTNILKKFACESYFNYLLNYFTSISYHSEDLKSIKKKRKESTPGFDIASCIIAVKDLFIWETPFSKKSSHIGDNFLRDEISWRSFYGNSFRMLFYRFWVGNYIECVIPVFSKYRKNRTMECFSSTFWHMRLYEDHALMNDMRRYSFILTWMHLHHICVITLLSIWIL